MNRFLWTSAVALILAGCATEYGQKGFFSGGFEETQLAPDVYSVVFSGNEDTPMARVVDFALLRCAEISLENGYPYFELIDTKQWTDTSTLTTPGVSSSAGSGGTYASSSVAGSTMTEIEPRASNTIRLLKNKDDASDMAYDAEFVATSIRAKYEISPE